MSDTTALDDRATLAAKLGLPTDATDEQIVAASATAHADDLARPAPEPVAAVATRSRSGRQFEYPEQPAHEGPETRDGVASQWRKFIMPDGSFVLAGPGDHDPADGVLLPPTNTP